MTNAKKKDEETAPAPRQHNPSHSLIYSETMVYCASCGATGKELFEDCPKPIDTEGLELLWPAFEAGIANE